MKHGEEIESFPKLILGDNLLVHESSTSTYQSLHIICGGTLLLTFFLGRSKKYVFLGTSCIFLKLC